MHHTKPPPRDPAETLGAPLRWLTRLSGSPMLDRLGLRAQAQKLIYRTARNGFETARKVGEVARRAPLPRKGARLDPPPAPARFDLTPTDEQAMVIETMRRFAAEVLRPAAEAADEACATPEGIFEQSHELGITLLAIPEAFEGAAEERSPIATALIAEELARGDMGLALAVLAPLGVVQALVDWGSEAQQRAYLPRFAGETFTGAALALLERRPLFDPMRPETGAVRDPAGGWRLYGEKSLVPIGERAEVFAVAAEVRGVGPRLFLVDAGAAGLTVTPEPAMGLRAAGLCRLGLDGVHVGDDALIGGPGREGFDFGAVVDRARIAWCALAVGACQAVLDYVIPYCNDRIAFGEPITNRQSVAFLIADIAVEIEGMRLLTHRAASRAEQGLSLEREVTLARTQCAAKAMKIGSDGVQLLGGHGFVKDHPVERWYRHLRAVAVMEGALLV